MLGQAGGQNTMLGQSGGQDRMKGQPSGQERFVGQGFYDRVVQQTISKDNSQENKQVQDFKTKFLVNIRESGEVARHQQITEDGDRSTGAEISCSSGASSSVNRDTKIPDVCPVMEKAGVSNKDASKHFSTETNYQLNPKSATQS